MVRYINHGNLTSLRTALGTVVLITSVLGQERQVDNLARVELAWRRGDGDGIAVRPRATGHVVAAATVVGCSWPWRAVVWVAVEGHDEVARCRTSRSRAREGGGDKSNGYVGVHVGLVLLSMGYTISDGPGERDPTLFNLPESRTREGRHVRILRHDPKSRRVAGPSGHGPLVHVRESSIVSPSPATFCPRLIPGRNLDAARLPMTPDLAGCVGLICGLNARNVAQPSAIEAVM